MKRTNLILAFLLAMTAGKVMAYEPVVKENKKWVYYETHTLPTPSGDYEMVWFPLVYEFSGDTVIMGDTWLKLWEDRYRVAGVHTEAGLQWEVQHFRNLELVAREQWDHVCVRRVKNNFPVGQQRGDETVAVYSLKVWGATQKEYFESIRLSKDEREFLYNFTGECERITINGTERNCYPTDNPSRRLIEGIGYAVTNIDGDLPSSKNFIDLGIYGRTMSSVLSHVIEDGEIIFKGEMYDYIHSSKIYDPDADEDKVGVTDLPASPGDGITYDMQGRRATDPDAPGIYIRDGHKILVP